MGLSAEELGSVLADVVSDYRNQRPPFEHTTDVVTANIGGIDDVQNRCRFLTLTTTLNYQREADRLYAKSRNLWENNSWVFDPEAIHEDRGFNDLVTLFERENFRYGKADAKVWHENSYTLYTEFDGCPLTLIAEFAFDAKRIGSYVRNVQGNTLHFDHNYRFPYLRGEKIRPLWLRVVHDFVHPLDNIITLEMPIDTHLIQITNKILGANYSNSPSDKREIQQFWRQICNSQHLCPINLDRPFWHIDIHWNEWGERYLEEHLGSLPQDIDWAIP